MQYTADVGEAFVRASEVEYEGASVHNLDGPEVSMPELIELIEREVPERQAITAADEPLPFPPSVDGVVVRRADRRLGHAADRGRRDRLARALPRAAGRRARQSAHGTPRRRVSTCSGASGLDRVVDHAARPLGVAAEEVPVVRDEDRGADLGGQGDGVARVHVADQVLLLAVVGAAVDRQQRDVDRQRRQRRAQRVGDDRVARVVEASCRRARARSRRSAGRRGSRRRPCARGWRGRR